MCVAKGKLFHHLSWIILQRTSISSLLFSTLPKYEYNEKHKRITYRLRCPSFSCEHSVRRIKNSKETGFEKSYEKKDIFWKNKDFDEKKSPFRAHRRVETEMKSLAKKNLKTFDITTDTCYCYVMRALHFHWITNSDVIAHHYFDWSIATSCACVISCARFDLIGQSFN